MPTNPVDELQLAEHIIRESRDFILAAKDRVTIFAIAMTAAEKLGFFKPLEAALKANLFQARGRVTYADLAAAEENEIVQEVLRETLEPVLQRVVDMICAARLATVFNPELTRSSR